MELCKDGGNIIKWFGVRDETSSGIVLVAVVEGSTEEVPRGASTALQ